MLAKAGSQLAGAPRVDMQAPHGLVSLTVLAKTVDQAEERINLLASRVTDIRAFLDGFVREPNQNPADRPWPDAPVARLAFRIDMMQQKADQALDDLNALAAHLDG